MAQAKIIAVAASKGGVSKSTTTWAIASFLARHHRVLVVDLDPLGSSSASLASQGALSVYDVLARNLPVNDAIAPAFQVFKNLMVLRASPALAGLDAETAGRLDRQYMIADMLASVDGFDFILTDTPAGQTLLTTGALASANYVLTPCSCDDAAFQQLPSFQKTIELIQKRINSQLTSLPVIASLYTHRQTMDRVVLKAMRQHYRVFDQVIPKRVSLREEMAMQQPCTLPEFQTLTDQILKEIKRHEQEKVRAPPPTKR